MTLARSIGYEPYLHTMAPALGARAHDVRHAAADDDVVEPDDDIDDLDDDEEDDEDDEDDEDETDEGDEDADDTDDEDDDDPDTLDEETE